MYLKNEYIQAILDITVDDVCVGEEPLSINFDDKTPDTTQKKFKDICSEFNSIVKWAARDLAVDGYSIYTIKVVDRNKLVALPYLEDVEFFLTDEKNVVCFPGTQSNEQDKDKQLEDKLIFINYDKSSLKKIEDKDKESKFAFGITPIPMQLRNVDKTISGLTTAEDSIARYRIQLGRLARFINVDVGLSFRRHPTRSGGHNFFSNQCQFNLSCEGY